MPGRGWCAAAPRRRQARPLIPRRRLPPRLGNTLVCDPPAGGPGGARRALAIPPCPRAAGRRSPAGVHHLCPIWLSLTRPPGKQAAVYTLAVPDRPEADAAETRTNRVHWHDRGAKVWEHCWGATRSTPSDSGPLPGLMGRRGSDISPPPCHLVPDMDPNIRCTRYRDSNFRDTISVLSDSHTDIWFNIWFNIG
jgi:hypothetical protein